MIFAKFQLTSANPFNEKVENFVIWSRVKRIENVKVQLMPRSHIRWLPDDFFQLRQFKDFRHCLGSLRF